MTRILEECLARPSSHEVEKQVMNRSRNEIEMEGTSIGSLCSPDFNESRKIAITDPLGVPKPTDFRNRLESKDLQRLQNLHKAKKSFRINKAQSHAQSQEAI